MFVCHQLSAVSTVFHLHVYNRGHLLRLYPLPVSYDQCWTILCKWQHFHLKYSWWHLVPFTHNGRESQSHGLNPRPPDWKSGSLRIPLLFHRFKKVTCLGLSSTFFDKETSVWMPCSTGMVSSRLTAEVKQSALEFPKIFIFERRVGDKANATSHH